MNCEITNNGYLYIPSTVGDKFPTNAVIAIIQKNELCIMPVSHVGAGGLILKQRNAKGDRAVFIQEIIPENTFRGVRQANWDQTMLALRIPLYKNS